MLLIHAVANVDVLTASNNDVKPVETRTVHLVSFCSYWQILSLVLPLEIPRGIAFFPTVLLKGPEPGPTEPEGALVLSCPS